MLHGRTRSRYATTLMFISPGLGSLWPRPAAVWFHRCLVTWSLCVSHLDWAHLGPDQPWSGFTGVWSLGHSVYLTWTGLTSLRADKPWSGFTGVWSLGHCVYLTWTGLISAQTSRGLVSPSVWSFRHCVYLTWTGLISAQTSCGLVSPVSGHLVTVCISPGLGSPRRRQAVVWFHRCLVIWSLCVSHLDWAHLGADQPWSDFTGVWSIGHCVDLTWTVLTSAQTSFGLVSSVSGHCQRAVCMHVPLESLIEWHGLSAAQRQE